MKKNYLSKNREEINALYEDIKLAYNEAFKKYDKKFSCILIHELCHFCFTSVCIKILNLKINFYLQILYFIQKNHKYLTISFIIIIDL